MLTVHSLSKSFGVETILSAITFTLNSKERLALVGPNGCGKTTLLRLLTKLDTPDSGTIHCDTRIGYLPQGLTFTDGATVADYLAHAQPDARTLTTELEHVSGLLAQNPHQPALQTRYDDLLAQLALAAENDGYAEGILAHLGLGHLASTTPLQHLSGGQKTRLGLAALLISNPRILLLDEPTNHLDIEMLEWLEEWLIRFDGAVLLVSHDRAFLDRVATGILELDATTHTLTAYAGNYSDYMDAKAAERDKQWSAYRDWQDDVVQLQAAARRVRHQAQFKPGGKGDSGDGFAKGFFGNRATKNMVGRAKNIERRVEHLLTEERVEKPKQSWHMKLDFGATPMSGRDVLMLEALSVGYETPLLASLNQTLRFGARAVLIGPNGLGKTTLLKTIAGQLPPLAGRARLGANVRLGYMAQEQETLDSALNALETISRLTPFTETEVRNFLHYYLFAGDDVFTPVGSLSYGERARLLLASLVAKGCNFLLLDEPLNHLDLPSRTRFEQALAGFDGTVLAVTHDRYFIASFASEVWEVKAGGLFVREV